MTAVARAKENVRRAKHKVRSEVSQLRYRKEYERFSQEHPRLAAAAKQVRSDGLTFLDKQALMGLAQAVLETERAGIEGEVVEAGTALGGSSIILAMAKDPSRPLRLYDTFGLIPPPTDRDGADVHDRYEVILKGESKGIGGQTYYGYREDLIGEVASSFERYGVPVESNAVSFVQGVYQDAMTIDFPVALAHVDCDWYDSVMTCLQRIEPHLVPGGRFVIDDYDAWSGARDAVDDFFAGRSDFTFEKKTRLHIVKH